MKFLYFFLVFQVLSHGAFGEGRVSSRIRLGLTASVMHPGVFDLDNITSYYFSAVEVLHFGANFITGRNPETQHLLGRVVRSALTGYLLFFPEFFVRRAAHEYAHFQAFSRAGLKDFSFTSTELETPLDANPFNAFTTGVMSLFNGAIYAATISLEDTIKFADLPNRSEFEVITYAAGLNEQQLISREIAERVVERDASLFDGMTLGINIYATLSYPLIEEGDINAYVEWLSRLGVETDVYTVQIYTQLPRFVSNSSLSFVVALLKYYAVGKVEVTPLALRAGNVSFFWPEFSSYLTTLGPTVNAEEYVLMNGIRLTFGYEVTVPSGASEVSAGWNLRFAKDVLNIRGRGYYNITKGGFWAEGALGVSPVPWLSVGAKLTHGDGYTFRREIVGKVPSFIEVSETDLKMLMSVRLAY